MLPCEMLAKHCLVLMPAYIKYPFVDITPLASCWELSRDLQAALGCAFSKYF